MKRKHTYTPWDVLSQYKGKFYNGEWPSLAEMFDISADRFPDRRCWECFVPEHKIYTFKEAKEGIRKVANYLYSLGVRKGDRVALTGKNSPEWAFAFMGIVSLSAIVVPVDYSLSDEEIEHLIDFVGIKGLFVDGERYERLGKNNKYGFKISLEEKGHEKEFIFNLPDVGEQDIIKPTGKDMAAFLFTSGTTGTPKACMLTHENFTSDAWQAQSQMNIFETDVFYAILPIHHAYTLLAVFIESICVGANVVFGKRLIINQMFKEMREGHVTMFLAVPMLFNKLLAGVMKGIEEKGSLAKGLIVGLATFCGFVKKVFKVNLGKKIFAFIRDKVALKDVRICICGGGPLPPATFKRLNQFGLDFVQGYGLTETSPILTLNPIFDYDEGSIGKVIAGCDMKFVDKDDQGNGEIVVKGSMVFQGYYNNEEATAEIMDKDGYLHTGDVGYINDRGFVFLTGRAKNIIVTEGGKNVFPEEIEDHFQLYFDIEQICVLGYVVDKEKKAESVCAVIYPSLDCKRKFSDKNDLQKHIENIVEEVNKSLLPYKRIRKTIVVDEELEMSSTKKVKRFAVRKKYDALING